MPIHTLDRAMARLKYATHASRPFVQALLQGPGDRVLHRWWKVSPHRSGPYVCYNFAGSSRYIYGFPGLRRVFSYIVQEGKEIRAYFYPSEELARRGKGLLKIAVLSEQIEVPGEGRRWVPLRQPRLIYSSPGPTYSCQAARIEAQRISTFLRSPQDVGSYIDLLPRRVSQHGGIRIYLDDEVFPFGGYAKYKGRELPGIILFDGVFKWAYFWAAETSSEEGGLPIIPEGHLMAEGNQILWPRCEESRRKQAEARRLGNFLFATVGARIFEAHWRVEGKRLRGKVVRRAVKEIRGQRYSFRLPLLDRGNGVFSVTREIGGRVKLTEYFRDEESFRQGESPFEARFITFRPTASAWQPFWCAVAKAESYWRGLVQRRWISRQALDNLWREGYLAEKYSASMPSFLFDE